MLGWGVLATTLGLIASRLALRRHGRPLGLVGTLLFATLVLGGCSGVLLGPLGNNNSPDLVRQIAALPVLALDSNAQHTFRIYEGWSLNRTNPLFVPLAALTAGLGLALARRLAPRPLPFLVASSLATLLPIFSDARVARFIGLHDDLRTWLPLPFIAPALVLVVARSLRLPDRTAWIAAGVLYGVLVGQWWGSGAWLALIAAPALLLGGRLGNRLYRVLRSPSSSELRWLLGAALVGPFLLGLFDLVLRRSTP
jgi:hypothetical protein